jgi:hypothetical protein
MPHCVIVLKILRGKYPPIPDVYSVELKGLVAAMLQQRPEARPSIRDILSFGPIKPRIGRLVVGDLKDLELEWRLREERAIDLRRQAEDIPEDDGIDEPIDDLDKAAAELEAEIAANAIADGAADDDDNATTDQEGDDNDNDEDNPEAEGDDANDEAAAAPAARRRRRPQDTWAARIDADMAEVDAQLAVPAVGMIAQKKKSSRAASSDARLASPKPSGGGAAAVAAAALAGVRSPATPTKKPVSAKKTPGSSGVGSRKAGAPKMKAGSRGSANGKKGGTPVAAERREPLKRGKGVAGGVGLAVAASAVGSVKKRPSAGSAPQTVVPSHAMDLENGILAAIKGQKQRVAEFKRERAAKKAEVVAAEKYHSIYYLFLPSLLLLFKCVCMLYNRAAQESHRRKMAAIASRPKIGAIGVGAAGSEVLAKEASSPSPGPSASGSGSGSDGGIAGSAKKRPSGSAGSNGRASGSRPPPVLVIASPDTYNVGTPGSAHTPGVRIPLQSPSSAPPLSPSPLQQQQSGNSNMSLASPAAASNGGGSGSGMGGNMGRYFPSIAMGAGPPPGNPPVRRAQSLNSPAPISSPGNVPSPTPSVAGPSVVSPNPSKGVGVRGSAPNIVISSVNRPSKRGVSASPSRVPEVDETKATKSPAVRSSVKDFIKQKKKSGLAAGGGFEIVLHDGVRQVDASVVPSPPPLIQRSVEVDRSVDGIVVMSSTVRSTGVQAAIQANAAALRAAADAASAASIASSSTSSSSSPSVAASVKLDVGSPSNDILERTLQRRPSGDFSVVFSPQSSSHTFDDDDDDDTFALDDISSPSKPTRIQPLAASIGSSPLPSAPVASAFLSPAPATASSSGSSSSSNSNSSSNGGMDPKAVVRVEIETARQMCEEILGADVFMRVYRYVRDLSDADDATSSTTPTTAANEAASNEAAANAREAEIMTLLKGDQAMLRQIHRLVYRENMFYNQR